jgi:site-specific DNA-methyltransferase (adenine-specific)
MSFRREDLAEGVTLYCGDCRDVLPTLAGVDAIITDPPYNSGLKYGSETDDNRSDYWEWLAHRIEAMERVAETVLIKHSALKVAPFLMRWPQSRMLVWTKPFSSGFPNRGFLTHWEPLHLIAGKAKAAGKDYIEISTGMATHAEDYSGHPAQFPVDLGAWLIKRLTDHGDVVCDPFMGSGTTALQPSKKAASSSE